MSMEVGGALWSLQMGPWDISVRARTTRYYNWHHQKHLCKGKEGDCTGSGWVFRVIWLWESQIFSEQHPWLIPHITTAGSCRAQKLKNYGNGVGQCATACAGTAEQCCRASVQSAEEKRLLYMKVYHVEPMQFASHLKHWISSEIIEPRLHRSLPQIPKTGCFFYKICVPLVEKL